MGSKGDSRVPTVDLSAFIHGGGGADPSRRQETARALAECCHRHGCAGITGHGVPVDLLDRAFAVSKSLFDLPLQDKLKAPHPEGTTPHRGYSGVGRERAGAKGASDTDDEETREALLKTVDYKVRFPMEIHLNLDRVVDSLWSFFFNIF